jgi:hypothetical protein
MKNCRKKWKKAANTRLYAIQAKKSFERFEFFPTFRSRLTVNHFKTCTAYSPEPLVAIF